jgi:hypothetical protein
MTYIIRDDIHSNELKKYEFTRFVSCLALNTLCLNFIVFLSTKF